MASIDLKNVTIKLIDGTAVTPNELEIKIGVGNLTYTERVERIYENDRGLLDEVRDGDEQPMDVTFDFKWDYISSTTGTVSIEDALKQTGEAASWVSTDADLCRPYALDVVLENVPSCVVTDSEETITLPDFRWEELNHDLRAASISCTGKCNATTATAVRS